MDRKELLLMVCRHADGSVDRERYGHLCNRWSPQAQAASLAARYAKYGSGFSPAARAAAAGVLSRDRNTSTIRTVDVNRSTRCPRCANPEAP